MADEWQVVDLERLIDPDRGISYGIVQPGAPVKDGVPIVRVGDIRDGNITIADPLRVSPTLEAKYTRTRLRGGELLLTLVGTVGEAAVAPMWLSGWNTARAVAVIPVRREVGSDWVKWAIRSPDVQQRIRSRLNTTVQATLNLRDVAKLPIVLPPQPEREAIARILGSLDDKIELNRRMSATLEAIAQALFKWWFVDFGPVRARADGREPGLPATLAHLFPARLADLELGEIPEGWQLASLENAFDIVDGRTLSSAMRADSGGFPAYGANGVIARAREAWVDSPCIVLGKIGSCGALHRSAEPCWVTNNAFAVRPGTARSLEFVWHIMRGVDFTQYIGGSANPYMPLDNFGHHMIVLPSDQVLDGYEQIAGQLRSRQVAADRESRTLADLRNALLPKLITGELRLSAA